MNCIVRDPHFVDAGTITSVHARGVLTTATTTSVTGWVTTTDTTD